MQVNGARIPPNGWHFFPEGPKGVRLEAHDKTTLIDHLFEWRLHNHLPTGTEEDDIDTYVCTKWPSACNLESEDYGYARVKSSNEELLYRVSRWASGLIDRMPRGGYTLVPAAETERRAALCRGCSQNQAWKGRCGGCASSTVSLLNQVRKLAKAPDGLRGCASLGWENTTACFLPFEALPIAETQRQRLPDHCWRK